MDARSRRAFEERDRMLLRGDSDLFPPEPPEDKPAGVVFELGQDDDADLPGMRYCKIIIDGEELTGWVNADAFLDFKERCEGG